MSFKKRIYPHKWNSGYHRLAQRLRRVQRALNKWAEHTHDIPGKCYINNLSSTIMKDAVTRCASLYYYDNTSMTPSFHDDIAIARDGAHVRLQLGKDRDFVGRHRHKPRQPLRERQRVGCNRRRRRAST